MSASVFPQSRPPADPAGYRVRYKHPDYGPITIDLRGLLPKLEQRIYFEHVINGRYRFSVRGVVESVDEPRRVVVLGAFGLEVKLVRG